MLVLSAGGTERVLKRVPAGMEPYICLVNESWQRSLLPAGAAVLRNQIIASTSRVATPSFAIDYVAVRRITRSRTLRAVAMVVASFAVRMAAFRVGATGMWEHGLRMRSDEKGGEQ